MSARSLRKEIVAGYGLLLLAAASIGGYALVRQSRAVQALRLQNERYLPLSFVLTEARAAQTSMVSRLESIVEERDRAVSRAWINSARRQRRRGILRARLLAVSARVDPAARADLALLSRVEHTLGEIERTYRDDEPGYAILFAALAAGEVDRVQDSHARLLQREQVAEESLRDRAREVVARMRALAGEAERAQPQTLRVLAVITALALFAGLFTALSAMRALRPLRLLVERVRRVAGGDLTKGHVAARDDEIGELAREFENMVDAVKAREVEREQARVKILQNERLAAIGRMAAHVTHEVRNPLSSIALNAEMLVDEARALGEPGREVERLVGAIQREADRLTTLTEEYLSVARLPKPRLVRENLAELVSETVAFARLEFERAGIALRVLVPGDPCFVCLDEAQVRQSLLNLLRNAREAVQDVLPERRAVTVSVRRDRDGLELAVADSGPGLGDDARAHLFELFYTTKQRGTGLGLPLTREIVQAHGGTIDVGTASAEDGGGARFVIWLPSAPAMEPGANVGVPVDAA